MKGTAQVVKGRIKEAAGALVGNDDLRVQGRTDQAVGRVKQAAENGVRDARESARNIVKKAKDIGQKAVARVQGR